MTVEEFLKDHCKYDLSHIASKMYPKNSAAKVYLSLKPNKKGNRSFTNSDAQKAIEVLKELSGVFSKEISSLTID